MIPVRGCNDLPEHYIETLLDTLGFTEYDKPRYPFILFLQADSGGQITNPLAVELEYRGGDEKKAYDELCELINGVLKSIRQIDRLGEMNRNTIFNLVRQATRKPFLTWNLLTKGAAQTSVGITLRQLFL